MTLETLFTLQAGTLCVIGIFSAVVINLVRDLKKSVEGSPVSRKLDVVYEGILNDLHRLDLYVRRPVVKRATVVCVGKRVDGSPWAWGKTVELGEDAVMHVSIQPQEPIAPGVILFVVGEGSLYSAAMGIQSLSPWADAGALFAMTAETCHPGTLITVGVKAA